MSSNTSSGGDTFTELAAVLAIPVVVLAGALALGASVAGLLGAGHRLLPFNLPAALIALAHFHDPAVAWPARDRALLPGPVAYWVVCATVTVLVLGMLGAAWLAWESRKTRPKRSGLAGLIDRPVHSDRDVARALSPEAARRRYQQQDR